MNLYNAWYHNLLNCGGTETRNQVLTKIGEQIITIAAAIDPKHAVGGTPGLTPTESSQEYVTQLYIPKSLADANLAYANEVMSEYPLQGVREICAQTGVRQDIPEVQMRAGAAIMAAGAATKAGELIPHILERVRLASGASGSSFWSKFSSGLKKLFSNPGEWLQRVFITEPGKAIAWAGRQLYSVSKNQWTKWLIDPLGVMRQLGTFFEELGAAMIDGAITTFDERRFAIENAQHWRQVGIALGVAAPFLPPPFNVIALGLSAVFTAASTAILMVYSQAETNRENEANAKLLAARRDHAQALAADARAAANYQLGLAEATARGEGEYITSAVLGPEAPDQAGKLFGLDAAPVILLASAALIWGLYGAH